MYHSPLHCGQRMTCAEPGEDKILWLCAACGLWTTETQAEAEARSAAERLTLREDRRRARAAGTEA